MWVFLRCYFILRLQHILCVYLLYKCSYQDWIWKSRIFWYLCLYCFPPYKKELMLVCVDGRQGIDHAYGWLDIVWKIMAMNIWCIVPEFSSYFRKWFSIETNVYYQKFFWVMENISGGLLNWLVLYPTSFAFVFGK